MDDQWAYERVLSHNDLGECSSFRCEIDNVVHRVVTRKAPIPSQRWVTLCGYWPEICPPSEDKAVNCLVCLAEGA
jgi:hypothetical protein